MSSPHDGISWGSMLASTVSIQGRRGALEHALSMLRTDWTRDHLLGSTPTNDAAIISSPLQQLHSLAFETGLVFGSQDSSNTHCNAVASSETVIVPAYSKDGISAGYLLAETYGVYADDLITAHNGPCAMRFLASEEDGTYVSLARQSRADVLIYFSHRKRSSTFYCFAFPRDTLGALVDAGEGDVLAYERAVHTVFCADNWKQCSTCGVRSDVQCACPSSFMRTKSPLDLSAIKHNIIQTHLGQALGKGLYEIFENGVPKEAIPVEAQQKILRVPKSGASKRLLHWAVGNALGSAAVEIPYAIGSSFVLETSLANTDSNRLPDEIAHVAPSRTDPEASGITPETNHFPNPIDYLDLSNPATVSAPSTACSITVPSSTSVIEDPGWPWNTTFSANPTIVSDRTTITNQNGVSLAVESIQRPVLPRTQLLCPVSAPVSDVTTQDSSNGRPKHRTLRIAPRVSKHATVASQPDVSELDADKMEKTAEELRAWRLYQRKIRNRESAARSNRARKRRIELARRKEQATSGDVPR